MRVIDINGRLATAGSWDETSQADADAQARLRATRTGLRAMLAGNEAFHVEADTPAPAAQESAKPEFAVGCRVVVLPHPDGGQHPSPFIALMSEDIGKSGTVKRITEAGNIDVSLDDRTAYIFPPSSLAIIQA